MSARVDAWLRRQAAREARIVTLEQALLGDRLWRYGTYRLRFFAVNWLVASAAHAVLALTLLRTLGGTQLTTAVAAHAAVLVAGQFWWGALEAERARVRDLHRAARPHQVPPVIASWVGLGLLAAAVLVVAAVVWTAVRGVGPGALYVALMLLRLAVELPVRAYHSGVYAVRRVRIPLAATVGPQLAGLAVLAVPTPYAPALAVFVVSVLEAATTLYWTRRLHHFLGIRLRGMLGPRAARATLRAWREALAAGAATAVMGLDGLVVLALLAGAGSGSAAVAALFLVLPTVTAGAEWARLLYFDLKRLELRLFANLRRRFERFTAWLAVLLGLAFGAVAATVVTVVVLVERPSPGAGTGFVAALVAFFVARSVLARAQIQAFADGAYAAVTTTGSACALGVLGVALLGGDGTVLLAGMAAAALACAAGLGAWHHTGAVRLGPVAALLTLEWLRALGAVRTPVLVGSAAVVPARGPDRLDARSRDDAQRWRLAQLAERVAHHLGPAGSAAWIGPDRVVWFERSDDRRVTGEWLQRASGGQVRRVRTARCPDGEQALLHAARSRWLGAAGEHLTTAILPVDGAQVRRAFHDLVPSGRVYDPAAGRSGLAALPAAELRAVLADATAFARDLRVRRPRSRLAVTPLCAGGELELVFVIDPADPAGRRAGRAARAGWNRRVTAFNLRAAVAGLRTPPAPSGLSRLSRLSRRPW